MTLTPQQMPALRGALEVSSQTGQLFRRDEGGLVPDEADWSSLIFAPTLSPRYQYDDKGGKVAAAALTDFVRSTNLYWVSGEMGRLAFEASHGAETFDLSVIPSDDGIVCVAGEHTYAWRVKSVPEHEAAFFEVYASRAGENPARLYLVARISLEDGAREIDFRDNYGMNWYLRSTLRTLLTTLELMQIPTVAEAKKMPVPAKVAKKRAKKGRVDPEVRIVTLRPMRNENVTHSPSGRKYHHRWLVRGHWRNQACGPKQSERKRTWVPSYTKGPDGAPLIGGDLVKVWKR